MKRICTENIHELRHSKSTMVKGGGTFCKQQMTSLQMTKDELVDDEGILVNNKGIHVDYEGIDTEYYLPKLFNKT